MANKTINDLTVNGALTGSDELELWQPSESVKSRKMPLSDLKSFPSETTLSTTTSYTPTRQINHLICDVSGGDITITINLVSAFAGMKIHIVAINSTGTLKARISGTGLYVNDIYVTENTGGIWLDVMDIAGLKLKAENGVTAQYTSGNFEIFKHSYGYMDIVSSSIVMSTGAAVSIVENIVFPEPFLSLYKAWSDITKTTSSKLTLPLLDENTSTVTNFIQRFSTNTGTAVNNSGEAEYRINARGMF